MLNRSVEKGSELVSAGKDTLSTKSTPSISLKSRVIDMARLVNRE